MATEDRTALPADGWYWLELENGDLEVVEISGGEMLRSGTDMTSRLESWPDRGERFVEDGRIVCRVLEPAEAEAAIAAAVAAERERCAAVCEAVAERLEAEGVHVRLMHDSGPQDGCDWCAAAIRGEAEPNAVNYTSLLRRYIAVVKEAEGCDFLDPHGAVRLEGKFTPDELALLRKLSEEANR